MTMTTAQGRRRRRMGNEASTTPSWSPLSSRSGATSAVAAATAIAAMCVACALASSFAPLVAATSGVDLDLHRGDRLRMTDRSLRRLWYNKKQRVSAYGGGSDNVHKNTSHRGKGYQYRGGPSRSNPPGRGYGGGGGGSYGSGGGGYNNNKKPASPSYGSPPTSSSYYRKSPLYSEGPYDAARRPSGVSGGPSSFQWPALNKNKDEPTRPKPAHGGYGNPYQGPSWSSGSYGGAMQQYGYSTNQCLERGEYCSHDSDCCPTGYGGGGHCLCPGHAGLDCRPDEKICCDEPPVMLPRENPPGPAPYEIPYYPAEPGPMCGNGILEEGEECDDIGDDVMMTTALDVDRAYRCTQDCKMVPLPPPRPPPPPPPPPPRPVCGNGKVEEDEECDDGANVMVDLDRRGYMCTKDCRMVPLPPPPPPPPRPRPVCGNAIVEEGEQCDDDANMMMNVDLHMRRGYSCMNCQRVPMRNPPNPPPVCGDSVMEGHEECDDGNTMDGDGCDSTCKIETKSRTPQCGDGIVDPPDETCDDRNTDNDDGCRNDCTKCGDGIVDPGETCDDGNSDNSDGCHNDCTVPICGDGMVDPGEECDDGNADNNDDCSNDCTVPCIDDPTWVRQGFDSNGNVKDCNWVGDFVLVRCETDGIDGRMARGACRVTCGTCGPSPSPSEAPTEAPTRAPTVSRRTRHLRRK